MKLKIFSLYALVLTLTGVLATSCSNDDIDIQGYGSLEIRVSTQGMYDDFDATNGIKAQLLAKDYKVGIYLYVYNSNGILMHEGFQSKNTFGNVSFTGANLTEGEYTAIVVETLVDDTDKSEDWEIIQPETLSTIAIQDVTPEDPEHYWYSVVGVAVKNFTFHGNQTLELRPEGIGSMFLCHFVNFEGSNYEKVGFATKNCAVARRLSPEYSGNDRFIDGQYTDRDHIYVRTTTKIDDYDTRIDTYVIDSGEITAWLCAAKDNSGTYTVAPRDGKKIRINDGETYYAGAVCDGSSAFSVNFVSTWDALSSWIDSVLDNNSGNNPGSDPEPTSAYVNPFTTWGASSTSVNSYMTGKGFESGSKATGSGDYDFTYYSTSDKSIKYSYAFLKSTEGLGMVLVEFSTSNYTLSDVRNFIAADYSYLTDSEGKYYYRTTESLVGVWDSEDGMISALFIPNTVGAPSKYGKFVKNLSVSKENFLTRESQSLHYMNTPYFVKKHR